VAEDFGELRFDPAPGVAGEGAVVPSLKRSRITPGTRTVVGTYAQTTNTATSDKKMIIDTHWQIGCIWMSALTARFREAAGIDVPGSLRATLALDWRRLRVTISLFSPILDSTSSAVGSPT